MCAASSRIKDESPNRHGGRNGMEDQCVLPPQGSRTRVRTTTEAGVEWRITHIIALPPQGSRMRVRTTTEAVSCCHRRPRALTRRPKRRNQFVLQLRNRKQLFSGCGTLRLTTSVVHLVTQHRMEKGVEPAGKERRRDQHYHSIRRVEPAGRTGRRDRQYEVSRDGEAGSSFSTGNDGRGRPGLQRRRRPKRPYIRNTDGTTA